MPVISSPVRRSATARWGRRSFNYGKLRNFTDAETKAAYDKIYNSHATFPCSNMPRFGSSRS